MGPLAMLGLRDLLRVMLLDFFTPKALHKATRVDASVCVTPIGVFATEFMTQGALCGFAAARPWALECNAFGVKTFDV